MAWNPLESERRVRLLEPQQVTEPERGSLVLPPAEYVAVEDACSVLLRPVGEAKDAAATKVPASTFLDWLLRREMVYLSW